MCRRRFFVVVALVAVSVVNAIEKHSDTSNLTSLVEPLMVEALEAHTFFRAALLQMGAARRPVTQETPGLAQCRLCVSSALGCHFSGQFGEL